MSTNNSIQNDQFDLILKKLQEIQNQIEQKNKPFLSMEDASTYLGLSKNTIYSFTSTGRIPFYKAGRRIFFSRDELNAWVLNSSERRKSNMEIKQEAINFVNLKKGGLK